MWQMISLVKALSTSSHACTSILSLILQRFCCRAVLTCFCAVERRKACSDQGGLYLNLDLAFCRVTSLSMASLPANGQWRALHYWFNLPISVCLLATFSRENESSKCKVWNGNDANEKTTAGWGRMQMKNQDREKLGENSIKISRRKLRKNELEVKSQKL